MEAQSNRTEDAYILGGLVWNFDDTIIAVATNRGVWLHPLDDFSHPVQLSSFEFIPAFSTLNGITTLAASPDDNRLVLGNSEG